MDASMEGVEGTPVPAFILNHMSIADVLERYFRYIVHRDLDKSGLVMMLASTFQHTESGCKAHFKSVSIPALEYHEIHITI